MVPCWTCCARCARTTQGERAGGPPPPVAAPVMIDAACRQWRCCDAKHVHGWSVKREPFGVSLPSTVQRCPAVSAAGTFHLH